MFIDQILYPINSLGPGNRLAIWTVGCPHHCIGCSNPELWTTEHYESVSVQDLFFTIREVCNNNPVDGITITGGEPFDQAEELLVLVKCLSGIVPDILLFSGYTYEEILSNPQYDEVLNYVTVLVDGRYVKELNNRLPLRGSSNQRVLLFADEYEQLYIEYLSQSQSKIQNIHCINGSVSVGIHREGFQREIEDQLLKKGIQRVRKNNDEMAQ